MWGKCEFRRRERASDKKSMQDEGDEKCESKTGVSLSKDVKP